MWAEHRMHASPDGVEYYNYPSLLARKYWYHVLCMGQATVPAGYRMKPQVRNAYLLHYVKEGHAWHGARQQKKVAAPGAVCLMDCSEDNEHGNAGPGDAKVWWLLFSGRDIAHIYTELRADRDPIFVLRDPARFEALFLELLELTEKQPEAYESKSFAVMASMLAELFESKSSDVPTENLVGAPPVLSSPIRKGIDYIVRFHADTNLGLDRICDASGLSLRHFTRLFKSETGSTPIKYLARHRVEQAKRLLLHSNRAIREIARLVGASNPTYFAYIFRQQTNMTPRQFRSQALNAENAKNASRAPDLEDDGTPVPPASPQSGAKSKSPDSPAK
jgi:AraC-like DNA-binding protein